MADKVHCAHILVKTELEAKTVVERLKKGETGKEGEEV
jgi:parvulin-like peptidyl-prolyl isomerase